MHPPPVRPDGLSVSLSASEARTVTVAVSDRIAGKSQR